MVWDGAAAEGKGEIITETGFIVGLAYSSALALGDTRRTSPEELIAAAHAACFSIALSAALATAGFLAERIRTTATLTMEDLPAGRTVTAILLDVLGTIPGASIDDFIDATVSAKTSCTVSRLLNANISMNAKLSSAAFPSSSGVC